MTINYNESDAIAIRSFLISKGLNEYAIAGLLANLYTESGLRSNNLQNSFVKKLGLSDEEYTIAVDCGAYGNFVFDSAGYGLCQWTSSGRKQRLLDFVKARGKSIGDRETQLDFMWWELSNGYKSVLNSLKNAKSVDEATRLIMLKFERPADQSEARQLGRVEYGLEFYKRYAEEGNKVVKIAIDAGHGLHTLGKRCMKKLDPNETREWILNNRIASKLETLLKSYNCEVMRVDDPTGQTDITLANRVKKANSWGADVYISIHHDAGLNGKSGGGTTVYYYSSKSERNVQAQKLYSAVVSQTGLAGNRASKIIKKDFYVIAKTNMPAFLIENGFMDSPTDVPIILSEDHAIKTAKGLLNFLVDHCKLSVSNINTPEPEESDKLYRVQVGAFKSKANAEKLQAELKAKGYSGIIV